MGIVHAIQKGDTPASDASPEAQKVAQDMKPSDVKDFASTSHKALPKKVKESILKKLKEYAMTLPGHHAKYAAPMEPLRSDDEMDLQEDRIPQSFNYGTTRDYHTKLATTPRKKYDKTNFNPAHSGQEDLQESDDKLEMLKLFNKALRMMPGSQKQKEIIKQLNVIRTRNGLQPLDEKKLINKIAEYASVLDNSYILNKDVKLDGTPEEKDAINREVKSIKETAPCWKGYKQVGMKTKGGKQVPNCVKESINESPDINSLKKIHDATFKFLKTKKGAGEVKEFSEFPNRYGDNVSTFSVKYNIEDKYNYDLQEIKIEYSTSRVFIPNKGYFPFKTFNDIKNIINKKSSLKESVNEVTPADVIKDLDKVKNDLLKKVDVLVAKKKKLYSNVDIESPMSADEKKLDKDIADLFSQINTLVLQKRNLKKESANESTKRDYKAEYKKFQSSTESKKYRAELNKYNRDKGTYGNGDGKDASHKNGKIVGFEDESVNRGRAEKSRLKKESVNETKVHFKKELKNGNIFQVVDRDTAGMRGTQDKFKMQIVDKRGKIVKDLGSHPSLSGAEKFGKRFESVNEELSFDEKEMVIGIIEILKQVEDPKNRMRIALNMLKKFKEEGIEFDYQKFMDHLKEYSMGSYEYDRGNRELGEGLTKSMKDVVYKLIPTKTFARHAGDPAKNREFVDSIIRELGFLLNRFYKQNDIDVVLK